MLSEIRNYNLGNKPNFKGHAGDDPRHGYLVPITDMRQLLASLQREKKRRKETPHFNIPFDYNEAPHINIVICKTRVKIIIEDLFRLCTKIGLIKIIK